MVTDHHQNKNTLMFRPNKFSPHPETNQPSPS